MNEEGASAAIRRILSTDGPLTGAELVERTRLDPLSLWRACCRNDDIRLEPVGQRYLRLDRAVEGYARLSPSIRREFLTYTLAGLAGDAEAAKSRGAVLREEIRSISRHKFELAREQMASVAAELDEAAAVQSEACFLIGGDVTYDMAHLVPRPESSTGKMVRGSDLDIVVIATDELADLAIKELDGAIYRRKGYLLFNPAYAEEIDYVIKRLSKVRDQLRFDDLRSMIACKIMWEGEFLCGSRELFDRVKEMVVEAGVPARIAELEARAIADREKAEAALLACPDECSEAQHHLFYTAEEGDEIA